MDSRYQTINEYFTTDSHKNTKTAGTTISSEDCEECHIQVKETVYGI